jgi:cell division protein FtsZ
MDIGLEEVEQAASLVQEAVHPDALTIFGATFDETLDDEIRVTVIATGFDKDSLGELPMVPVMQAAPAAVQTAAPETVVEQPARVAVPTPLPEIEKVEEEEDDVFGDILKIFSKRD